MDYTETQQEYVDYAERRSSFEEAVLHLYALTPKPKFVSSMNAYRYAWLIDGAPCLEDVCDELFEECPNDDEYDDC